MKRVKCNLFITDFFCIQREQAQICVKDGMYYQKIVRVAGIESLWNLKWKKGCLSVR